MGDRTPGVVGMDPFPKADDKRGPGESPGAGFTDLGPNGMDPLPMTDRIIAKVEDDWHPPAPDTSATVTLKGKTLEQVGRELDALDEWGRGGGSLRTDTIPAGNSTNLTVKLHGNLLLRLPNWPAYASASPAVKKEWDRMIGKLKAHEQRHMDIAIEHGNDLAKDLIGEDIGVIAKKVTAANQAMATDQQKLDTDTDHGAKPGVTYGDVFLDTTIT